MTKFITGGRNNCFDTLPIEQEECFRVSTQSEQVRTQRERDYYTDTQLTYRPVKSKINPF